MDTFSATPGDQFLHQTKLLFLLSIVVVLKTLPTKEAVEALGKKVWETMKQKDPREVLTMIPNDRGFDLSSPEATAALHVTTIIPNLRKLDSRFYIFG